MLVWMLVVCPVWRRTPGLGFRTGPKPWEEARANMGHGPLIDPPWNMGHGACLSTVLGTKHHGRLRLCCTHCCRPRCSGCSGHVLDFGLPLLGDPLRGVDLCNAGGCSVIRPGVDAALPNLRLARCRCHVPSSLAPAERVEGPDLRSHGAKSRMRGECG